MAMSNLRRLDPPGFRIDEINEIDEEDSMSTLVATDGHGSPLSSNLRIWRTAVFAGIGALYVASLFVPPLREALAKVFAYFPQ
jgi:hypothetical protein